jgi:ArsR family transcriptional regulator
MNAVCAPGRLTGDGYEMIRALADPTRWLLLQRLAVAGEGLSLSDLSAEVVVTAQTVSYHLRVLRRVGLVSRTRRSRGIYYTINPTGIRALLELLHAHWPQLS